MQVLLETEVTSDQIDHLGHMNVMFYAAHARTGATSLLAKLGLADSEAATVVQRDSYTRHHREQLLGSPLEVRGGVLDATPDRIRLYEELANNDTGAIAAAFVLGYELVDGATHAVRSIPDDVLANASGLTVALPEHGRSRSIPLDGDPIGAGPSLSRVRELGLAERLPRTVEPAICDAAGYVLPAAIADLVWGGTPVDDHVFRPLEPLDGGGQMGFATMETRATWARSAKAGDRVQSFAAQIAVHDKAMVSRHWVFDVDREDLVATFTVVSLGFDVTNRRAVSFPPEVRVRLDRHVHPELAPDAAGS